jgi:CheY-like chemotaxis protein/HPt (histidine-containing phosphotransfer) domain-containing protein
LKIILLKLFPEATILEAKDGDEAVDIFNADKPDIIFMDIQMPAKSGYEATMEIRNRKNGKNVPIIACTAGALMGEREKCLEAGMNDYISKPIVKENIHKMIEKWLVKSDESEEVTDLIEEIKNRNETHFNREELRERYGEVMDILDELLMVTKISLNESRAQFEEIRKLTDEEFAFEVIKNAAHKVKGTALSMSFEKLAVIAKELEGVSPPNSQKARGLMEQLIDEIIYLEKNVQEL